MKYLIVNGDDFGYSRGVNRGIIKAHTNGIVTSTSVLVDGNAAAEASTLSKYPILSVGLHFSLVDKETRLAWLKGTYKTVIKDKVKREFERQIRKFIEIVGRLPDHLDGHYHIHIYPRVRSIIGEYSKVHHIPVRAFGKANFIDKFYGQNKLTRKTYLHGVSVENLLRILANLKEGINELMCHPGIVDEDLKRISSYNVEREIELKTLTNREIINFIKKNDIKLCSWNKVKSVIMDL